MVQARTTALVLTSCLVLIYSCPYLFLSSFDYLRLQDDNGELSFEEFRMGVRELSNQIHVTRDDFEVLKTRRKIAASTAT